ncbi:unnamed protein product [Mytilus coruscus]|uniref:Uncharacterized protein n=1 Tax=Mytilus coruscus TaxID=42192 RepID=A0A6J8EMS6_MYTCO|nr:unnamed protein product [Mytilus coruscus]
MEEPADCGMNVAEIDFLDVDMVDDVDDLTLSQVCKNVENEYFAFEGLQNLTLTQTLQNYQQGERCIADFFKVHLDALANDGNFYRRPLKGIPGTPIRYGNQPLGINKLESFMKMICTKACPVTSQIIAANARVQHSCTMQESMSRRLWPGQATDLKQG